MGDKYRMRLVWAAGYLHYQELATVEGMDEMMAAANAHMELLPERPGIGRRLLLEVTRLSDGTVWRNTESQCSLLEVPKPSENGGERCTYD